MSDSRTKIKAITDKINKKYKSNTLTCGDDLANYEILPTPFAAKLMEVVLLTHE